MDEVYDTSYEAQEELAGNYLAKSTGESISNLRNPPVRKIIEQQIADYEKNIQIRKDLLSKLDENKGVEEVLDILRKVGI